MLLKNALQYYENKPLWYKDALKRLGLEYGHHTFVKETA